MSRNRSRSSERVFEFRIYGRFVGPQASPGTRKHWLLLLAVVLATLGIAALVGAIQKDQHGVFRSLVSVFSIIGAVVAILQYIKS